ncbi:hypothetical protein DH2020_040386 [Rehmannia glutinosa]|uniref:USP domain-containing protein n=1 Tax=Rehmannia glutinosa TaxID=99300 RepID=A0ABR0UT52_REHGL
MTVGQQLHSILTRKVNVLWKQLEKISLLCIRKTDAKICSDASQEFDDSGSSISSTSCFFSSTEQSESSSDASISEVVELGTPPGQIKHLLLKKTLATKTDESLKSTSFKDKRRGDGVAVLEEIRLGAIELRSSQSSSSVRTSSAEDWRNLSTDVYNNGTRLKPTFKSSGNCQKLPIKTDSPHVISSEIEGVRNLSQDTRKSLKTSQIIFPLKLFMQLYSCDDVALHPFGLVNCGNRTLYPCEGGLDCWVLCVADVLLLCKCCAAMFDFYSADYFLSSSRVAFRNMQVGRGIGALCVQVCTSDSEGTRNELSFISTGLLSQIQPIGREEDAHENVVDKMQSVCLEEAGVSGSLAEDSTLIGLTFGGYLDPRCKSYEKAKKKLTVLEAPNILTISGNLEKLNKLVKFPEVLNLSPYMSDERQIPYISSLCSVVHLGLMNAAYSGHYVSYVKDFRGDWFRIDDSRVSHVDLKTVLSVEAYILFYARHTPRGAPSVRNISLYSDGKAKRNTEAIPSSNNAKKKNSKTKLNLSGRNTESTLLHQVSDKHPDWMSPSDFTGYHVVDPDGWGFQSKHRNLLVDSSSDSSSIFSASDAGSYSTDSTKDSSAEEISGYLFGLADSSVDETCFQIYMPIAISISTLDLLYYVFDGGGEGKGKEGIVVGIFGIEGIAGNGGSAAFGMAGMVVGNGGRDGLVVGRGVLGSGQIRHGGQWWNCRQCRLRRLQ